MSQPEALTVSALTARIKSLLEERVGEVAVSGEISNFRRQASGHCYFTLKDEGAQIPCALFKGSAARLGLQPADGVQVIARGEISVYAPRGAYQLIVRNLEPVGQGDLHRRFEMLKRKLQSEGLFSEERKKPLPRFVERIGIITSPTGAAVRDVIHVLQRRCPRISLTVRGVRVQGDGAAGEVAEAIRELGAGHFDLLLVVRGGGSLEDLWAFNEEAVARALAACPLPTISGVGHETDFTICDFVADLRAPTPSAAAEMASRPDQDWRDEILAFQERLITAAQDLLGEKQRRLELLSGSYVFREPRRMVEMCAQRVDELGLQLQRGLEAAWRHRKELAVVLLRRWNAVRPERKMAECHLRLKGAVDRLRALGPEETLRRGYALVQSPEGTLIREAGVARQRTDLRVRFADGVLPVRVQKEKGGQV